jgi:hypothetical protein
MAGSNVHLPDTLDNCPKLATLVGNDRSESDWLAVPPWNLASQFAF